MISALATGCRSMSSPHVAMQPRSSLGKQRQRCTTACSQRQTLYIAQYRPSSSNDTPYWTTNSGAPVWDNYSSMTVGPRGPILLEDYHVSCPLLVSKLLLSVAAAMSSACGERMPSSHQGLAPSRPACADRSACHALRALYQRAF